MDVDVVQNMECVSGGSLAVVVNIKWIVWIMIRSSISLNLNNEVLVQAGKLRQRVAHAYRQENLILLFSVQHLAVKQFQLGASDFKSRVTD